MGCNLFGLFRALFILKFLCFFVSPNSQAKKFVKDIVIEQQWSDAFEIVSNRGASSKNLLEFYQSKLSVAFLQKQDFFNGFENIELTFFSYSFRSPELIFETILPLLKNGAKVRIVYDANTNHKLPFYSSKQLNRMKSWKREAYHRLYDSEKNPDGYVSRQDVDLINIDRNKGELALNALKTLQKEFGSSKLDLISQPMEVFPSSKNRLYPRMQHFKSFYIKSRKSKRAPFKTQYAFISSANPTDSDLDVKKKLNKDSYRLETYKQTSAFRHSVGNINLGVFVKNSKVAQEWMRVPDQWLKLYKRGKSFDQLSVNQAHPQRFVFSDKGKKTMAYMHFSQGWTGKGDSYVDLIDAALSEVVGDPANTIASYTDTQFVFSHHSFAKKLRRLLSLSDNTENFRFMIHKDQALAQYSALPSLLFAPTFYPNAVFSAKAISLENKIFEDFADQIWLYDGNLGDQGGRGDLLHSKSTFIRYHNSDNKERFLLTTGSANHSSKASRYNADGIVTIVSDDGRFQKFSDDFISSVFKSRRKKKFSHLWLTSRFKNFFNDSLNEGVLNLLISSLEILVSRAQSTISKRASLIKLIALVEQNRHHLKSDQLLLDYLNWLLDAKLYKNYSYTDAWSLFYFFGYEKSSEPLSKVYKEAYLNIYKQKIQEQKFSDRKVDLFVSEFEKFLNKFDWVDTLEDKSLLPDNDSAWTKALDYCQSFLTDISRKAPQ